MNRYFTRLRATFAVDAILPDLLALVQDGLAFRKLLGRSTREAMVAAVAELHEIVWHELLVDSPDGPADTADIDTDDVLFVTPVDLARRAGADPSYVRRLCRRGVLTSRKVRGRHFIERDAADAWLARQGTRRF